MILLAAALAPASAAFAQTYPKNPVKIIVPYAPGGALDIMGRIVGRGLHEINGQPYLVREQRRRRRRDRDGGGLACRARWLHHPVRRDRAGLYCAGALRLHVGYDPLKDLIPVPLIATAPLVLVSNPALPFKTVSELIAYAKSQPGKMNYASAGNSGPDHLAGELFKTMAGLPAEHVPYKGSLPALVDAVAGHIQYLFVSPLPAMPLADSGKLRLLASAGEQRSPYKPTTPTVGESLPGFEVTPWWGFFVPARTPPAIVAKIGADVHKLIAREDVQQEMLKRGVEPATNTPEQFAAFIRGHREVERS